MAVLHRFYCILILGMFILYPLSGITYFRDTPLIHSHRFITTALHFFKLIHHFLDIWIIQSFTLSVTSWILFSVTKHFKCVWSENTTITNFRQTLGTNTTITRHQDDKLSMATSSLFPNKMFEKLEWTQSNAQQNEQLQDPRIGATINNDSASLVRTAA